MCSRILFLICCISACSSNGSNPPPTQSQSRGGPLVLAMVADEPSAVAIDGSEVYWVTRGQAPTGGRVMRVSKDGGMSTVLVQGQTDPVGIVLDPNFVYWATSVGQVAGQSAVWKAPRQGGVPVQVFAGGADSISSDGSTLVWCTGQSGVFSISSAMAGTGAAQSLGTLDCSSALAFDAMFVYAGSRLQEGQISRVPRGGGTTEVIAHSPLFPVSLVADESSVFAILVSNQSDFGQVAKVPLAGGSLTEVASGQVNPGVLTGDATTLYWTTFGQPGSRDGAVWALPKTGGTPRAIAQNLDGPLGLAVDEGDVYVIVSGRSTGMGSLERFPKK